MKKQKKNVEKHWAKLLEITSSERQSDPKPKQC